MPSEDHPLPRNYRVTFQELRPIARGVKRPECVLALSDGSLLASHGYGGYSVIGRDRSVRHVIAQSSIEEPTYLPNGISLAQDGKVLFAHLGVETGGVFSISNEGLIDPVITELDGRPLPPTNFVVERRHGEIWFTVSTRLTPRSLAWNKSVTDGYIAVKDRKGVRIVADGLGYTNEIAFSPDRRWIYANETYAQRLCRFPLHGNGTLGDKEIVAEFGGADLPDGLTFDAHGGIWVTCIASNRLLLVRPGGEVQVIVSEPDLAFSHKIAAGLHAGSLTWADMQGPPGNAPLGNCSSLAFGLAGSGVGYIGSLTSDCIWEMPVPIRGDARTAQWHDPGCHTPASPKAAFQTASRLKGATKPALEAQWRSARKPMAACDPGDRVHLCSQSCPCKTRQRTSHPSAWQRACGYPSKWTRLWVSACLGIEISHRLHLRSFWGQRYQPGKTLHLAGAASVARKRIVADGPGSGIHPVFGLDLPSHLVHAPLQNRACTADFNIQ